MRPHDTQADAPHVASADGDDAHLGAQTLSPYSADYFFYHTAAAVQRLELSRSMPQSCE